MLNLTLRSRVRSVGPRAFAVAIVLTAVTLLMLRVPLLRAAGSVLVISDPLSRADVIVVTIDSDAAGLLEAADLVHARIADHVAIFADPPDAVDLEFIRRGLPCEDRAAQFHRLLGELGVQKVVQIPRPASGTEAEGQFLPDWCARQRLASVIVVTSSDHARRVRRVLHRAMKDTATKVMIRPTRYSSFDPSQWWRTRDGARTGIVELEKLLLDVVRHPLN